MKQLYLVAFSLFILNFCAAAQDYTVPVEYMNAISQLREGISKKFMAYVSASAHGKRAKKVEALRSKLLDEVQEAKMNIGGLPSFKGDKSYRDTTVNFLRLYYNVLNDDYSKIINMEEIAEQSYDAMEAYMMAQEMVNKKLEEGNDKMKLATETFAAKNNITLTKDQTELGEKITQVHEVNKYHTAIYLIFFKPYKQENYLIEAVSKNNITGIEQNKSSLLRYAQDGLEKLKSIKAFEGDNNLLSACKTVLNFYVKEVNDKMNTVSEFYLTKERFETIKKEFEKKSSPSKSEVDAYNKAVKDINAASDAFNNTNQALNKERNEVLNDWNKTVNAFFDEHTPRYK
jgi:predicted DNA-binding protein